MKSCLFFFCLYVIYTLSLFWNHGFTHFQISTHELQKVTAYCSNFHFSNFIVSARRNTMVFLFILSVFIVIIAVLILLWFAYSTYKNTQQTAVAGSWKKKLRLQRIISFLLLIAFLIKLTLSLITSYEVNANENWYDSASIHAVYKICLILCGQIISTLYIGIFLPIFYHIFSANSVYDRGYSTAKMSLVLFYGIIQILAYVITVTICKLSSYGMPIYLTIINEVIFYSWCGLIVFMISYKLKKIYVFQEPFANHPNHLKFVELKSVQKWWLKHLTLFVMFSILDMSQTIISNINSNIANLEMALLALTNCHIIAFPYVSYMTLADNDFVFNKTVLRFSRHVPRICKCYAIFENDVANNVEPDEDDADEHDEGEQKYDCYYIDDIDTRTGDPIETAYTIPGVIEPSEATITNVD